MGQGAGKQSKDIAKSESTLHFETGKRLAEQESGVPRAISENLYKEREKHTKAKVISDEDDDFLHAELVYGRKSTVPTVFRWEYGGKEVYLSGSFNEWKTRIPMSFSGGEFTAIIELPEGEHQYKYLVDGHWIHDPNVPTVNDTFGGRNNVMTVKPSDFDAVEALEEDAGGQAEGSTGSLRQWSPPGSYSQLIPSPHTPLIMHDTYHISVPPHLPPHLLNAILNKDAVDEEDPTLLPVPDHVALNHLYALSIKDGVMTLSATHRYKRKYVTTVFYKPVK